MNFIKFIGLSCLLFLSVCAANPTDYGVSDYNYNDDPDYDNDNNVEEEPVDIDLPTFVHSSQDIKVTESETLTLDCSALGTTSDHSLIFKHYKQLIYVGSIHVDKKSKFRMMNSTFELRHVKRSDGGNYACVYNKKDEEVKIVYNVVVQYPSKVTTNTKKQQTVLQGSSVTVACQAEGNPKPVITWSKSKGRLPSGLETEEGYSMTMENVDRHVEGTYICKADNGVGMPKSIAMKVTVQYRPEIITEQAVIRTGEGDKVELVCIVHARPVAEVTWFRNGSPLTSENPEIEAVSGGHRHSLAITGVKEENYGEYECAAENSIGKSTAVINLSDEPKQPQITSPTMSAIETMYTLAWETESYYPITAYTVRYRLAKTNDTSELPGEWHEESVPVTDNLIEKDGLVHRMQHDFKDLLPATNYQAAVVVKNKFKQGNETMFNFSTRKEMVGMHTTAGGRGDYHRMSVAILLVTLVVSMNS